MRWFSCERVPQAPSLLEQQQTCITVFGFAGEDTNLIVNEFERCGAVVRRMPVMSCNWIHLQFDSRLSAQRVRICGCGCGCGCGCCGCLPV